MIFKQYQQVLDGTKSQTRRPKFPYELAAQLWKYGWMEYDRPQEPWTYSEWMRDFPPLDSQIDEANAILAEHVITLPVQPGRGKKAVGRIRITKIRRERLGEIGGHFDDILAEGVKKEILDVGYDWFMRWVKLWESTYGKGAWERMKDEDVFVLEFEPCDE